MGGSRRHRCRRQLELPGIDVEKDVDVEVAHGRLLITSRRTDVAKPKAEPRKIAVRTERPALGEAAG